MPPRINPSRLYRFILSQLYVLSTEQKNITIAQNCSKSKISDRFLKVSKGLPFETV